MVLVSKDLYYLKNVKTGAVGLCLKATCTFLLQPAGWYDPLDQVLWMPHLFKESTDRIYRVVTDTPGIAGTMSWGTSVSRAWYYRWDQNSKLLIRLNTYSPPSAMGRMEVSKQASLIYVGAPLRSQRGHLLRRSVVRSGIQSLNAVPSTTTLTAQLMIPMDLQGCWIRIST